MNKKSIYLMIVFLTISIIIFSGCTGKKASPNQSSSKEIKEETKETEKIKIPEIPDFTLKSKDTFAYSKNSKCNIKNIGTADCTSVLYKDNISEGSRFGGFNAIYFDITEKRKIKISTKELDDADGVKEYIDNIKTRNQASSRYIIKFGDPNIGDYSMWMTTQDPIDPDIMDAEVLFLTNNKFVQIEVTDKKDMALDEVLKISKQLS